MSRNRRPLHAFFSPVLAAGILAAFAPAQVTSATVDVGGPGACGSEGGNPPTLSDGTPASGSLGFEYDAATGVLEVEVTNTSDIVGGQFNPLITGVYFNLPSGAVTDIDLTGQSGSGGATAAFSASFNLDLGANSNSNRAGPFGAFSVCLGTEGGIRGGIANASAPAVGGPPGAAVVGPVTFTFQLQGPALGGLTADSFADAGAVGGGPCTGLNVVLKFQAGGANADGSAWIGNGQRCVPTATLQGQPCIGNTVTFTLGGPFGCSGCLILTANPTPTPFLGFLIPGGPPYYDVLGGQIGSGGPLGLTLTIPDDPSLVGLQLYYFGVMGDNGGLIFSPLHSFTICQGGGSSSQLMSRSSSATVAGFRK